MFDRLKKAFSRDAREKGEAEAAPSSQLAHPVSEWAATRGFGFSFTLIAAAFLAAALFWTGIPETAGKTLD